MRVTVDYTINSDRRHSRLLNDQSKAPLQKVLDDKTNMQSYLSKWIKCTLVDNFSANLKIEFQWHCRTTLIEDHSTRFFKA